MQKKDNLFITSCIYVVGIFAVSNQIYPPALPQIAEHFSVSKDLVQNSVALNLFGLTLTAFIYGPASDIYGRRPTLLVGMGMLIVMTVLCTQAQNINQFLVLRFIQGCTGGCAIPLGLALIKNLTSGTASTHLLSRLGLVLVPLLTLSPVIGGNLVEIMGWESIFYFNTLITILHWILVYKGLPKPIQPERNASNARINFIQRNIILFKDRNLSCLALINGLQFSCYWCYAAAAPFYFIQVLKLSPSSFGYLSFAFLISQFIALFITQHIVKRIGNLNVLKYSLWVALTGALLFLMAIIFFPQSPIIITLAAALLTSAISPITSAANSMGPELFPSAIGAASSAMSGTRSIMSFLGIFVASLVKAESLIYVALYVLFTSVLSYYLLNLLTLKPTKERQHP